MKKLILIISLLILTSCTQPHPSPLLKEREGKENSLKIENTGIVVGNGEVKEENKTCILGNEIYGKWSDLEENRYFMSGGFIRFNEIDNNGFKLKGDLLSTLICKGDESFLKTTELKSIESKVSKESKKLFGKDFYTYWINKSGDYTYLLGYGLDSLEKGGFKSVTNDDFWKNNNSENVFLAIINSDKINIIDLGKLKELKLDDFDIDINTNYFFSLNNIEFPDDIMNISFDGYGISFLEDYFIISEYYPIGSTYGVYDYKLKKIIINKSNFPNIKDNVYMGNLEFTLNEQQGFCQHNYWHYGDIITYNNLSDRKNIILEHFDTKHVGTVGGKLYQDLCVNYDKYGPISFLYHLNKSVFNSDKNFTISGQFQTPGSFDLINIKDIDRYKLEKTNKDNLYSVTDLEKTKELSKIVNCDEIIEKNDKKSSERKELDKKYYSNLPIFDLYKIDDNGNYVLLMTENYRCVSYSQ